MATLQSPFRVTISGEGAPRLSASAGEHFRVSPAKAVLEPTRQFTARQVDLVRIGAAIHLADGWVRRPLRRNNGYRCPLVEVELLDHSFWEGSEAAARLKSCVDFLSGGDSWSFQPRPDSSTRHAQQPSLFGTDGPKPIVSLYSGGLDSAAGLAIRLSEIGEQRGFPVTVRYQHQRVRVVKRQFDLLRRRGIAQRDQINPFQVGMLIRNRRLRREYGVRFREDTHRCRAYLFYAVAGLAAHIEGADTVEVYESGIGAINLPLVSGRPEWCTTRSTHPEFLRRMADLVNWVSEGAIRYTLPFLWCTKGEMTSRLAQLDLGVLGRTSVSCITHPLRRGGNRRQCGTCPACVFRRQAMWCAGISEGPEDYVTDVFASGLGERDVRALRAFRQQAARLAELDDQGVPGYIRRHLFCTKIVSSEAEMAPFVRLLRRFGTEWTELERAIRLPNPTDHQVAIVGGGTSP